jgi:hypothetical protein
VPPVVGPTLTDAATLAGARGFLLGKGVNGPPTPITFPGAPRTLATGVNDRGQITGAHETRTHHPQPATRWHAIDAQDALSSDPRGSFPSLDLRL